MNNETEHIKLKLAFFSPLPPLKSGISDYSVKLLPALSKYYDVTIIIQQDEVSEIFDIIRLPIHSVEWFVQHTELFNRIVYQIGNSRYHSYMIPLLAQHPGVVVLHDFFMGGMLSYEELVERKRGKWTRALWYSHGYQALKEYGQAGGIHKCKVKYPANKELIENARGIIAHSNYTKKLAEDWYGSSIYISWDVIPQLQVIQKGTLKERAREILGFSPGDCIVCSFGHLDRTKLNDRIIQVWNQSELGRARHCKLVFVGQCSDEKYMEDLYGLISDNVFSQNITITGWVDLDVYNFYLEAADIGVQLRKLSRGETSAAVHDCMNHGLATIVNANGAMAELAIDSVHILSDHFSDDDMTEALEKLYIDKQYRHRVAQEAKKTIRTYHTPEICAKLYRESIEKSYDAIDGHTAAITYPAIKQKQIIVDVSVIVNNDLKTGIERVVRARLLTLMELSPRGYRIEPVYLSRKEGLQYMYARHYMCTLLGTDIDLEDEPVEFFHDDIFYGLDYCPQDVIDAEKSGLYAELKDKGISINFTVYDLLPVLYPNFFPKGASTVHNRWLRTIESISDRLICISNTVADELKIWYAQKHIDEVQTNLQIEAVHLGADIDASYPSKGMPDDAKKILSKIKDKISFLMVGTIEPRKGYLQTIAAFELLWEKGIDVNLIIVGKMGWGAIAEERRRTIPYIVKKIQQLEDTKNFYRLDDISDEYLERVYKASTCLIAASIDEGFGLPLIEASQHKIPIIARSIPVFKEIAGAHAFYFEDSLAPDAMVDCITKWLKLYQLNNHKKSDNMKWLSWKESTQLLLGELGIKGKEKEK